MRIPAGVTLGGRNFGGRFASPAQLARLADDLADLGHDAAYFAVLNALAREADERAARVDALTRKFQDDPKRYARQLDRAEGRADAVNNALTSATGSMDLLPPDYEGLPDDDLAEYDEWEIGFSYE